MTGLDGFRWWLRVLVVALGAATLPLAGPVLASSAVLERPDEASAAAFAQQSGQRVAVARLRTETQEVFANPSGTFTVEQHARPVRVRGVDGTWSVVDTTLRPGTDGVVAPVSTPVALRFSAGGSGPLARIGLDGRELALTLHGVTLPVPALAGDTAVYAEVMPGVDLHVRADVTGFSEVLVVKTAVAAANPALARLRFGVGLQGLTLMVDAAGNIAAVDAVGTTVFQGPTPRMWDSSGDVLEPPLRHVGPAAAARQAAMKAEFAGGELAVTPDQSLFNDPAVRYPVYLDPSFAATKWAWTPVSNHYANSRFFNSGDVAKAGHYHDNNARPTYDTLRSFFRMGTRDVRGKQILSATLRVYEVWASSCSPRPVELWLTGAISATTTWNSQPGWLRWLSTQNVAKGNRGGGCDEGTVEFDATSAVADAARNGWDDVTVGLRASNESDPAGWKKFRNDPVLVVEYNTPPGEPDQLVTDPRKPCAEGVSRPYIGTATPFLRARVPDADPAQRLTARFYWQRVGDTASEWLEATNVPPGQIAEVKIPAGKFVHNGSYRWWVVSRDGWASSPQSRACEFTVDTNPPGEPTISFTEQEPLIVQGTPVSLTFKPAVGDTDVVAYKFGVNEGAATPTITVWANKPQLELESNGSAVWVPVTPTRAGINVVSVVAVDRAGLESEAADHIQFSLNARERVGSAPHVRRDIGGDGKADVTFTYDWGNGRTSLMAFPAEPLGRGFADATPVQLWDPGTADYPMSRIKTVAGDFDADGLSDVAVFRDEGSGRSTLRVLRSDGNSYSASQQLWDSGPCGCWGVSPASKMMAGDFNGDGRDDLVQIVDSGGTGWATWVWISTSDAGRTSFASPANWLQRSGFAWDRLKPTVGDFNGDGKADLALFYHYPTGTSILEVSRADGNRFVLDGEAKWTSTSWNWVNGQVLAGDFNGDGKDDLAQVYDLPKTDILANELWELRVWKSNGISNGISFAAPESWYWHGGSKGVADADSVSLAAGDFTGDGLADVAIFWKMPSFCSNRTNCDLMNLFPLVSQGAWFDEPAVSPPQWRYTLSELELLWGSVTVA